MAPTVVRVGTLGVCAQVAEAHSEYGAGVAVALRAAGYYVDLKDAGRTVSKRVREAQARPSVPVAPCAYFSQFQHGVSCVFP